jgi:ribosomal protein S13
MIEGDLPEKSMTYFSFKRIHVIVVTYIAGLPVRGQRTKSNARTKRGAKKQSVP